MPGGRAVGLVAFGERARYRRQRGLALARQQRDLALVQAALLVADVVVLRRSRSARRGLSRRIFGRRNIIRLLFCREPLRDLNSLPRSGMSPRNGMRSSLSVTRVLHQAAEHDDAAVLDQDGGADGALVGRDVDRAGELRAGRELFLLDLEQDRVALADVRGDLEDRADLLALDGLEGLVVPVTAAVVLVYCAGDERHLLRDLDLGLLVVHGDRGGRRDDVGVCRRCAARQHRREIHAGVRCGPMAKVAPFG